MAADRDRVDYESVSYREQRVELDIWRDVLGGTRTLRNPRKRDKYLIQNPAEDLKAYERRAARSNMFNGAERTKDGLTGMVFRKDPQWSEVPDEIMRHLENIDQCGTSADVFAHDRFEAAFDGHAFILVDRPPGSARTRSDEEGARPYWIGLDKRDVINWRTEQRGTREVTTLFVYREGRTVADGAYGEDDILRYRVLRLGSVDEAGEPVPGPEVVTFEVWEQRQSEDVSAVLTMVESGTLLTAGGQPFAEVPVAVVYANRLGLYESAPPLLDLAYEQLRHCNIQSAHDHAVLMSCFPILTFIGMEKPKTEVTVGPNYTLWNPNDQGDIKWIEPTGGGIAHSRQTLQDSLGAMAAMGLSMLVRETRSAETARAKMIDKSEQDSRLSVMARSLQDALNEALRFHGMFMGVTEPGAVAINRDFQDQEIDAQLVAHLRGMVSEGTLSIETMWMVLQNYEVLPDWFDPEEERQKLDAEGVNELLRSVELEARRGAAAASEPDADRA